MGRAEKRDRRVYDGPFVANQNSCASFTEHCLSCSSMHSYVLAHTTVKNLMSMLLLAPTLPLLCFPWVVVRGASLVRLEPVFLFPVLPVLLSKCLVFCRPHVSTSVRHSVCPLCCGLLQRSLSLRALQLSRWHPWSSASLCRVVWS